MKRSRLDQEVEDLQKRIKEVESLKGRPLFFISGGKETQTDLSGLEDLIVQSWLEKRSFEIRSESTLLLKCFRCKFVSKNLWRPDGLADERFDVTKILCKACVLEKHRGSRVSFPSEWGNLLGAGGYDYYPAFRNPKDDTFIGPNTVHQVSGFNPKDWESK